MEIKGNELQWILKLAEERLDSEEFQERMKETPKLLRFLNNLMARFHPNNFYAGNSKNTWILVEAKKD